jgi:hypothetical protein
MEFVRAITLVHALYTWILSPRDGKLYCYRTCLIAFHEQNPELEKETAQWNDPTPSEEHARD